MHVRALTGKEEDMEEKRRISEQEIADAEAEIARAEAEAAGTVEEETGLDPQWVEETHEALATDLLQEIPKAEKEFDPRYKDAFEGLLYVGRLEDEFEEAFHRFVIRTVTAKERMQALAIVKDWEQSMSYVKPYKAALVAAALVSVDGVEFTSLNRSENPVRAKFEYITENWHDAVIDILYTRVEQLEAQVLAVLKELGAFDDTREIAESPEKQGEAEA